MTTKVTPIKAEKTNVSPAENKKGIENQPIIQSNYLTFPLKSSINIFL